MRLQWKWKGREQKSRLLKLHSMVPEQSPLGLRSNGLGEERMMTVERVSE